MINSATTLAQIRLPTHLRQIDFEGKKLAFLALREIVVSRQDHYISPILRLTNSDALNIIGGQTDCAQVKHLGFANGYNSLSGLSK
jgi:hypothetical protein